jgi:hypothetical protein
VTVYFGSFGLKISIWFSGTAAINLARSSRRCCSVRSSFAFRSYRSPEIAYLPSAVT